MPVFPGNKDEKVSRCWNWMTRKRQPYTFIRAGQMPVGFCELLAWC
jgi:hypothetical protein